MNKTLIGIITLFSLTCMSQIKKNLEDLQKCKVVVKSVKASDYKFSGVPPVPKVIFNADVEIENPNESDVNLNQFAFDVSIQTDEEKFSNIATVKSPQAYKIPAKTKELIDLQIETVLEKNYDKDLLRVIASVFRDISLGKEPVMLIDGSVTFETALGNMNVPFRQEQKVKIPKSKKQEIPGLPFPLKL